MQGTPFGRYRLVTLLGRGGMGEVWRAHDTETDRVVAIKLLPPYLSGDEEFKQRFRREAHAAARLNDPHVIPIHNYGEIDGRFESDKLLFADGNWTFNFDGKVPCQAGGSPTANVHYELPVPQPAQDPIMLLTGHGRRAVTGGGACANSYDEERKYERTGD